MARFLIEVPHESSEAACARAIDCFQQSGPHFFTHASWGCKDGVHAAWLIVDVESRDEAKAIVPTIFRANARVVQLNDFTGDEIDNFRRQYK